jgi:hypothetical protein
MSKIWDDRQDLIKWQKQYIIIISSCRPTHSNDPGNNTCYSQEWRAIRRREGIIPKSRDQFINNSVKNNEWERCKYKIIIGADLNESMSYLHPKSKHYYTVYSTTMMTHQKHTP